jgi:hypothetical protein
MDTTQDLLAKAKAMLAQTSAQGTQQFAGSSYDTGFTQAQAPTSPAAIVPLPSAQMPNNTPTTGNTSGATATTAAATTQIDAMQKYFEDQMKLAKEQADALQTQQDQNKSFLSNLISSTPSTSQTRADAYSQIGIDPSQYFADQKSRITEIDTLNQEYNKFKAEADQQKAQLIGQGRGIPMDLLNNQAAQIDRNAAPRLNMLSANINSKAAVLQSLQGNFNEARSFVNQAVEDATADTKFKFDTIKTFYDMNQDSINRLDTKYQNALQSSMELAKFKYEEDLSNKQYAGDAMIKYNSMGAGITINDTPGVVAQKIASVGGELGYLSEKKTVTTTPKSTGVKFTNAQILNGSENSGLPTDEFKQLPEAVQNFFVNAPQKDIDDLTQLMQNVVDETQDIAEATEVINSFAVSKSVKDYFISLLPQQPTKETNSSPGFFETVGIGAADIWNRLQFWK